MNGIAASPAAPVDGRVPSAARNHARGGTPPAYAAPRHASKITLE
jgi:hypothetical protein